MIHVGNPVNGSSPALLSRCETGPAVALVACSASAFSSSVFVTGRAGVVSATLGDTAGGVKAPLGVPLVVVSGAGVFVVVTGGVVVSCVLASFVTVVVVSFVGVLTVVVVSVVVVSCVVVADVTVCSVVVVSVVVAPRQWSSFTPPWFPCSSQSLPCPA
jgi:hypothetical protein